MDDFYVSFCLPKEPGFSSIQACQLCNDGVCITLEIAKTGPGGSSAEWLHFTFEFDDWKLTLHRPHPGKEALRYRVLAVREFIARMGIEP